jgi:hypothetical protein
VWRLLAAHRAPVIVALLQSLFTTSDKELQSSVLMERLGRDMDQLRTIGEDLGQTPQVAVAEWLSAGYLTRRLPAGVPEEVYELSMDSLSAIRFLGGALHPRTSATESRLSLVIEQLARLAEETDENPETRVAAMVAERDRLDAAIERARSGAVTVLAPERALERAREIMRLSDELPADFRFVREEFERLNRGLRQSLVENDGSRANVLEALFAGVDVIGESESGRTFTAFFRLLTDTEQSQTFAESIEAILRRAFAAGLEPQERKFLLGLQWALMAEGSAVHDVMTNFARSLKAFVGSREFLEQRRLNTLLRQASQAALAAKDHVRPREFDYTLELTSSAISSVSRWVLYDPALRAPNAKIEQGEESTLDLATVAEMVQQSEIDIRSLKKHVIELLNEHTQVSIAQLLQAFPAEQGLGSVVGYLALAARHGEQAPGSEVVHWVGGDEVARSASVPAMYFMRERSHELVA